MQKEIKKKLAKSNLVTQNLSHLYLNGKDIDEMVDLKTYKNLKVLYMHNNKINALRGLDYLYGLTHLYLQWNNIAQIENLNHLQNLQKLYLSHNKLEKLENIEKLKSLKELHLDGQVLLQKVEFKFDVTSVQGISKSLEVLNISKLNLTEINNLKSLNKLKILDVSNNQFKAVEDIAETLGNFLHLTKLNLYGCPAQKDLHYREKVTAASYNLEYLDNKFITKTSRTFIKRLQKFKIDKHSKEVGNPAITFDKSDDVKAVGKRLSFDILNKKMTDDLSFRPWNSLTFIQKPVRMSSKKSTESSKPRTEYTLEGKNISN